MELIGGLLWVVVEPAVTLGYESVSLGGDRSERTGLLQPVQNICRGVGRVCVGEET